jgi:phosphatidylcholine synthase
MNYFTPKDGLMTPGQSTFFKIRAWTVHLYTSLGLICSFIAMIALMAGDVKITAIILAVSNIIDATDGTLARAWNVKKWAPGFDGRKLDDITDYINYTFIPIIFAYRFHLIEGWGNAVLGFVLILSAYGFCQISAKTNDGYFTGFPNFWNILVLYLYLFKFSTTANAVILLIFAFLVLLPVKFISYSTKHFRLITALFSLIYAVIVIIILVTLENIDMRLVWLSLVGPAYYIIASLYLNYFKPTH